eukprot:1751290-Alexandrium_andersonii.AAC.1
MLRFAGRGVDDVDIVNSGLGPGPHVLSSDHVWTELRQRVASGLYDFVFMGTPCETFSRARTGPP